MLYHVFVSYNRADRPDVEPIVRALTRARFDVFFDVKGLSKGLDLHPALEQAIRDSSNFVLFVGPNGIGPTQRLEVQYAHLLAAERKLKFIWAALPGAKAEAVAAFQTLTGFELAHSRDCYEFVDLLAESVLETEPIRLLPQMGKPFHANLSCRPGVKRRVELYPLPKVGESKRLKLTWETFGAAIERLKVQIDSYTPHLNLDACIGLNEAGTAISAFLAHTHKRLPRGYLQEETRPGVGRFVTGGTVLPKLGPNPTLLLVDRELKSGSAVVTAVEALQKKYASPKIYYAVLAAKVKPEREDLHIQNLEDLVAWERIAPLLGNPIEDLFIACTMTDPGIEPPLPAI